MKQLPSSLPCALLVPFPARKTALSGSLSCISPSALTGTIFYIYGRVCRET